MQTTSAAFDDAVERPDITLVGARVRTDWAQDGYDGDGYVDDLTIQAGQPITVTQSLDDGMPNDLSDSSGGGVAEATVPMDYGQRGLTPDVTYRDVSSAANDVNMYLYAFVPPPQCEVGDLLIAVISLTDGTVTLDEPASWEIIAGPTVDDGGNNTVNTTMLARRAEAIDTVASGYMFTFSGVTAYSVIVTSFPSSSFYAGDAAMVKDSGTGTSHTTPAVTSTSNRAVLIGCWARGRTTSSTWTPDPLDTEIAEIRGTHPTQNISLMMSISAILEPGAYTRTATTSSSTSYATMGAVIIETREGTGMNAAQYFSPFNAASPVYFYERDTAPVTIDQGIITADGQEYVRIFTGQMMNTPVKGRAAELDALSATRMTLAQLVQPPAIVGVDERCNGTWPVMYTLHKAGMYGTLPPRDGCRLWMPTAGSLHPMIPDTNNSNQYLAVLDADILRVAYPDLVDGPYIYGVDAACYNGDVRVIYGVYLYLGSGTDVLSQTASTGRIELWVRGDECDLIDSPRDSVDPVSPNPIIDISLHNGVTYTTGHVRVGVDSTRHVFVYVDDGDGHTATKTSTGTVSTDGAWYCIGGAWSISGQKLWVYLDGVEESSTYGTLSTAGLPAVDNFAYDTGAGSYDPSIWAHIPIAELQLTGGAEADPDTYTDWLDTVTWTATAEITASQLDLIALAEKAPRESWEYLGTLAQAELASIGVNEYDMFRYLSQAYWARDAQQTPVDALSTTMNVGDLNITLDNTRIRNICQVTFGSAEIANQTTIGASLTEVLTLPPYALRLIYLPASDPLAKIQQTDPTGISDSGSEAPTTFSYFTANDDYTGGGNFALSGEVYVNVVSWTPGQVELLLQNNTGLTWYFVNTKNWDPIGIASYPLKTTSAIATVSDDKSVYGRGERALTVSQTIIQKRDDAIRYAQYIVDLFGKPVARVVDAEVFGDPRRQSGDMVTFADAENTAADGNWRETVIKHTKNAGEYTQQVSLTKSYTTGIWIDDAETDPDVLAQAGVWDGNTVWADDV